MDGGGCRLADRTVSLNVGNVLAFRSKRCLDLASEMTILMPTATMAVRGSYLESGQIVSRVSGRQAARIDLVPEMACMEMLSHGYRP
jgi:hypothetical protein